VASTNLDIVRSIYAAWERGDYTSADWADPQIEFAFADGPEPGSWKGISNMSRRYSEWLSGWKDFSAAPEEYIVVDEKRILVLVHNRGRGRMSGLALDERSVANFFEISGGKVIRLVLYWNRNHALADLGLDPEAGIAEGPG
jgi:ketosteroid isomerase-like protein